MLFANTESFKAIAPLYSSYDVLLSTPAWQCKFGTQIIHEKIPKSLIKHLSLRVCSVGRVALWHARSDAFSMQENALDARN